MARIPLPERGQPLDLTYIYQIANAINEIAGQVSTSTYRYVTIDSPPIGKQGLNASETRIVAVRKEVVNNTTVNAGDETAFEIDIVPELKYPPVVTATLENFGGTSAGKSASVILKPVTAGKVSGSVKFNATGDASIMVNVIIIGVPQ
jgi:hypothetical protein